MKRLVTPFLMFAGELEAAVEFYTKTFPNSSVSRINRSGNDGAAVSAEFTVGGQRFLAYNGGPHFAFADGFSLFVLCESQNEVDEYWAKIVGAGGQPQKCGWITDPFGLSWQIVPKRFVELSADRNARKAKAVVAAMLKMVKFDVAELERAYEEA